MKTIICIVGKSGSGKDTAARYLAKKYGYHFIPSYTTRPMRPEEEDGREHIFKDSMSKFIRPFAYRQYGGYEYWTTWSQFKSDIPNVYVVDEDAVSTMEVLQRRAEQILKEIDDLDTRGMIDSRLYAAVESIQMKLVKVYINRKNKDSISKDRTDRDRGTFCQAIDYDFLIDNDSSLHHLMVQMDAVANSI